MSNSSEDDQFSEKEAKARFEGALKNVSETPKPNGNKPKPHRAGKMILPTPPPKEK